MKKWLALPIALLLGASPANAAPDVPAALDEWRGWALHGKGYRNCPFLYNAAASAPADFVCAWPGPLALDLNAEGGTFSQRWTVYDAGPVPLPGSAERWPREVAVDGRAASVVLRAGVPTVWLSPGSYQLRGSFVWRERPPTLAVPGAVGLVALVLDGRPVPLPQREDGLWLGTPAAEQAVADALSLDVFRRLEDNVPTRLETRLQLSVAGGVREERLESVLPAGFVPMQLASGLPVRLDRDGQLLAQVRPGDWEIVIHARADAVLDRAEMGAPGHTMPGTEVWSFDARPELRSTLAEGARPVDPARAGSPWLNLPTFRLEPGEALTVVERSRGQQVAVNSLQAKRDLWLDFDRRGFTFADRISGAMRVGWRLDVVPPYALLAAAVEDVDLLITRNATDADATGVELRSASVDLRALGRIDSRETLPVAGWQSEMGMDATLHLPPGNRLLAALGVDDAPSAWASQWRLLDFFVLLIIVIATVRLFGRVPGLIALVALTLSFHEPGAPVWTWLNLLAAVALVRVAPPGRLLKMAKSYRLASFAVLLLFLIPFGISQLRLAVYPQLEPASHRAGGTVGLFELLAGRPVVDDARAVTGAYIRRAPFDAPTLEAADSSEEVYHRPAVAYPRPVGADATPAQAGPGEPAWDWAAHSLAWAGDVNPSRAMRLIIAPPWLTGVLRLVAAAALGVFAALLAFEILGRAWRWPQWRSARSSASGAMAALALLAVLHPATAHAETPAPALLEALERRLLEPPACAPACAEVVHAKVAVAAADVAIDLEIHALEPVAVPLPGDAAGWLPASVVLGDAAVPVQRRDGTLWAQVPAGRHTLVLRGPLPPGDAVQMPFAALPRTVAATATAWLIAGIEDGALPGGTLSLTRLRQEQAARPAAQWEASRFPAFVTVERTLQLGTRQWRVATVVRRVAPAVGAITLAVPLLAGEAIVSAEHSVAEGRVAVAMAPSEQRFAWESTLPQSATVTLAAAADQPWQEIWRLEVSPAWQVAFAGLPASHGEDAELGRPAFHPRPGETLAITVARPTAVAGNTLAFDRVDLEAFAGRDGRRSELALDYRSTRGGSHAIRLPPGAVLEAVAIDGKAESLPLNDGVLNLPILPAAHEVRISWRDDATSGLRTATPVVELGAPAANVATALAVPERWLLFATGPALGPAVLYWSELLALVVASLVLGRIRATPLKTWHWLLLGLGFSTFSWLAFAVVAGWLLAYGARERLVGSLSRLWYNAAQIAFGLLALVAFGAILNSIPHGLLGEPDMSVAGYGAGGDALRWFADKTASATPEAALWSLPKWVYQALILAWAIWLTLALLRWLPWAWRCFSAGGLWQPKAAAPEAEDKRDPAAGEAAPDAGAPPKPPKPPKDVW